MIYCTNGLFPIKWEIALKVSEPKSEVVLMKQCCAKNKIKKSPESAIATFLAIEDFNRVESDIVFLVFLNNPTKIRQFKKYYNVLLIIYNEFK